MNREEETNIALVRSFYAHLEKGDRAGAYAAVMAADCELHEAEQLPYGGHYCGRDTMMTVLAGIMAEFDEFECEIRNYLAGMDEVVVHLHLSGVGRISRKPFSTPAMELWRIRDGRVVELRPFLFDASVITEALR